jgi:hypothetical protein
LIWIIHISWAGSNSTENSKELAEARNECTGSSLEDFYEIDAGVLGAFGMSQAMDFNSQF